MFNKSIGLALLLMGYLLPSQAKDPEYPVSAIPANLKEKAHVVKRMEELTVRLVNPGEVRVTRHYVLTILDAKGDRYASIYEDYSKLKDVRSIKGRLLSAEGVELSKIRQNDITDVSGVGDEALMSDTRYKVYRFSWKVYPYTIEVET
ncbi:MAG: transglutaminase domain protein, partial [Bacteroidetes bacterium]|nr:transglutaminase domain protein [Bacteroidota bacterium]